MNADTPPRSLQQRREALARANAIRTRRKNVKAELRAGTTTARAILMSEDPDFATWKIADLLLAVPAMGKVKVNRLLRAYSISPSKSLAGLSDRQRRELLSALP